MMDFKIKNCEIKFDGYVLEIHRENQNILLSGNPGSL